MSWFFLFGFHSYLHGHSHSLFNGTGARCHTSHDIIVRKVESILLFAGQQDVEVEDAGVFKWCIHNLARRQRYAKAMGNAVHAVMPGCCTMGRHRHAGRTRTGRGRISIARAFGRSRGAGTPRWTALFSTARRRRTRETRSSAA